MYRVRAMRAALCALSTYVLRSCVDVKQRMLWMSDMRMVICADECLFTLTCLNALKLNNEAESTTIFTSQPLDCPSTAKVLNGCVGQEGGY